MLSGWIKSVSESVNFFSPQTPVIFAGDFGTREMLLLLTATRPQGERIDFISKNCSSEMPIFLVTERIVNFDAPAIPTPEPIVALLTISSAKI